MKKITLIAAILIGSLSTYAQTWSLDKAHAKLGFTAIHLMISDVEGWFKSFDAKVTTSKDDFTDAVIELTADVNSVNTENEKRDNHLRSADFFDVAKYPSLIFKSKSFTKVDGKKYKLSGDLTMHGVTKPVELDVTYNGTVAPTGMGKKVAGFKVTGSLKRSDYNLAPSTPDAMLGNEVKLIANLEFNLAQAN